MPMEILLLELIRMAERYAEQLQAQSCPTTLRGSTPRLLIGKHQSNYPQAAVPIGPHFGCAALILH